MTIAISLKVNDGVVLAADSASTLTSRPSGGAAQVVNVYNHADKVFNLKKGLPIGGVTWGTGAIGASSVSTLVKDLRRRLSGDDDHWVIDPTSYSVRHVADRVREFLFEEMYEPAFSDWSEKPPLGFIVAGYSSDSTYAEEYQIEIVNGECGEPRQLREPTETGVTWGGETEAIHRLVLGYGTAMPGVLQSNLGVPQDRIGPFLEVLKMTLGAPLVQPGMPFQDAIRLARFLVNLTIQFSDFAPGAPTVGGAIDIAAITRHEGFKWVERKHYYRSELNPMIKEE